MRLATTPCFALIANSLMVADVRLSHPRYGLLPRA